MMVVIIIIVATAAVTRVFWEQKTALPRVKVGLDRTGGAKEIDAMGFC